MRRKQQPFFENLLIWRGLPNLLIVIGMAVSLIFFFANIYSKEMQIEREHQQILQAVTDCQKQIEILKATR